MNRRSFTLSPNALRSTATFWIRFDSSTKRSDQTAAINSSLVIVWPCRSKKATSVSKTLGVRGIVSPLREMTRLCRLTTKSSNRNITDVLSINDFMRDPSREHHKREVGRVLNEKRGSDNSTLSVGSMLCCAAVSRPAHATPCRSCLSTRWPDLSPHASLPRKRCHYRRIDTRPLPRQSPDIGPSLQAMHVSDSTY